MESPDLLQSFVVFLGAGKDFLIAIVRGLLPYAPLAAWAVFWFLAVDWSKLYPIIVKKGGIIGLLLLWFTIVLVWGVIAPPATGHHDVLGLHVGTFQGKAIFATTLYVIAFCCASAQLAGVCRGCMAFDTHSVDEHGGHDHDSHSHDSHDSHAVASHGSNHH